MAFLLQHRWLPPAPSNEAQPADEGSEGPVAFVLHGALGSGQNFRRFVQQLAARRPEYRFVLVDLRCHGDSAGAPAPHTLSACAADLEVLAEHLGESPRVLIGHSFGGKVAIAYAQQAEHRQKTQEAGLEQIWVLDSVPGAQLDAQDSEVSHVIRAVRTVPMPAASRREVVAHLTEVADLSPGLAEWMATNLRREGSTYVWRFDLDGIEQLMGDYFRADLWGYLSQQRSFPKIELVVAERSSRWTPALRKQAADLGAQTEVRVHALSNAGHWVHVDNPQGLLDLLDEFLV